MRLADIGKEGLNTNCAWQESQLAVLWTVGVFALNFGPVIVGPVLDYVGPKLTAMLGGPLQPLPSVTMCPMPGITFPQCLEGWCMFNLAVHIRCSPLPAWLGVCLAYFSACTQKNKSDMHA